MLDSLFPQANDVPTSRFGTLFGVVTGRIAGTCFREVRIAMITASSADRPIVSIQQAFAHGKPSEEYAWFRQHDRVYRRDECPAETQSELR